jgi:hypothetical protein
VVEAGRLVGVLVQDDVIRGLRLYQLQRHPAGWRPAHAGARAG